MAKVPPKNMRQVNYRTLKDGGIDEGDDAKSNEWWLQEPGVAKSTISGVLNFFQQNQFPRLYQWEISAKLYSNISMSGIMAYNSPQQVDRGSSIAGRLSDNIIQSTIDTLVSKMSKNKPFPLFCTSDGNYKQRRKAQKLNQFLEGIFLENDAYELGSQILKDACIFGTGCAHVFMENDRVKLERVLPHEIWIDELEGVYGAGLNTDLGPRSMHRCKLVDRSIVKTKWPDQVSQIDNAPATTTESYRIPTVSDMIVVRESWHLPSEPGAKDGRHMITTDSSVLLDEEWTHDNFPFVFIKYNPRVFGFWGQGLAEMLQHIQLESNRILFTIGYSYQLAGSYKILMENSSKISSTHFDNRVGTIIKYTGTPPTYLVPGVVPPEMYTHRLQLKQDAYAMAGISQLSANSQKPEGLNSGKALREFNDIESDRFMTFGQSYERLFVNIGKKCVQAMQDRKGKGYKVKSAGRFLEEIDWKDIGVGDDEYVLQVFPVSSLPNTPEGRMQTVTEYVQAGWLSPSMGRRLMDFPDLAQVESLQNAQENHWYRILDRIIDEDDAKFEAPESFDDLQLGRRICLEYYSRYRDCDLEQEKLELIRRMMDQITYIENAAQAQLQAQQAALNPPQVPQAKPVAPPKSDLIQNVPGPQGAQ